MSKGSALLIGAAVIIIAIAIYYYNKVKSLSDAQNANSTNTCFDLPNSSNPLVFGSKYWAAFHGIANKIPCGACKGFGVKLISYAHDLVNKKLAKPIYDQANFDYFNNSISKLNMGVDFNTAFDLNH